MSVMGIALQKGQLRYSVLEGTKDKPVLVDKGRLNTIAANPVPDFMDWFDTHFRGLLKKHKPSIVCYKIKLEPDKEQLFTLIMPLGVLNLICKQESIPSKDYNKKQFTGKRIGLDSTVNLYNKCDEEFGNSPPYWDVTQKESVIIAWFEL